MCLVHSNKYIGGRIKKKHKLFRQASRFSLASFPVMPKPLKTVSYEGCESRQNIYFTVVFREHLLRICCTPEISDTNIKGTDAELDFCLIVIL